MGMVISKTTQLRLQEAIQALDAEIEAVLQQPASETLIDGGYLPRSGTNEDWDYRFKTATASLRFVEEVRHIDGEKSELLTVVSTDSESITLRFTSDHGPHLRSVFIEWENDFILKKTRESLERLLSKDSETGLLEAIWHPERLETLDEGLVAVDDGSLNISQAEAVQKSLDQAVSFIWGPPGTGKTSTLGYIIANALMYGKRVLFASNTNRAVDVGCLSAIQALHKLGATNQLKHITRFGDPALSDPELDKHLFDKQIEQLILSKQAELVEEDPDKEYIPNEMMILKSRKLVCTTLARVCTSDLLAPIRFDMVVIDEASMASLPFIMALASKADAHIVIAGDPMQLPPISMSQDPETRAYLEEDAFSRISGARSTAELFAWHDRHPSFTSFFELQYRMRTDMAGLISDIFYEGRLRSSEERQQASEGRSASVKVIDTSAHQPVLEKKEGMRGFQPVNPVHGRIVTQLLRQYTYEMGISMQEMGIIVPFRSGVYAYRKWLRDAALDAIEVGTIHTYQGREKRVIVFDTMMTGEPNLNGAIRHYTVRPFDEDKNGLSVPRLLNVALSRAKDRLILVADFRHIDAVYAGKFLGRLLHKAEAYGDRIQGAPNSPSA